jgi:hypothetical protein
MSYVVTTAQDLVRLALLTVGAIGQGDAVPADELQDAMLLLNDLLEDWNNQSLAVYTVQRYTFPLPTIKQVYTLGAGGDFDIPRPARIEAASMILNPSSNSSELPMDVLNYSDWQAITVKNTQSPIPRVIWPDYQFPLINVSFWPIPNQNNTFVLYAWQALSAQTSVTADMSFPMGYKRALRYNLARELFVAYGREVSPEVVRLARESLANLKRLNSEIRKTTIDCDVALMSTARAFNWMTGETV